MQSYQEMPTEELWKEIAPSYLNIENLRIAAEIFVICVKLVSVDKILNESTTAKRNV